MDEFLHRATLFGLDAQHVDAFCQLVHLHLFLKKSAIVLVLYALHGATAHVGNRTGDRL